MTKYQVKDSAGEIHEIDDEGYHIEGEYVTFYCVNRPPTGGSIRIFNATFYKPISVVILEND